ncbi:MAG: hypothetical protein Q8Q02_16830 [Nocardioides sp.]|nr:hypothetical protein [Nocardioides sp.]
MAEIWQQAWRDLVGEWWDHEVETRPLLRAAPRVVLPSWRAAVVHQAGWYHWQIRQDREREIEREQFLAWIREPREVFLGALTEWDATDFDAEVAALAMPKTAHPTDAGVRSAPAPGRGASTDAPTGSAGDGVADCSPSPRLPHDDPSEGA